MLVGKVIVYQFCDYCGVYLFFKFISEVFLLGYGFLVGVVNFNYLMVDELEKCCVIKVIQVDFNEGGESFFCCIEKLFSCDLFIVLCEYVSGVDVVLGGKVYCFLGIMFGKVFVSGQELLGDYYILWFWYCCKCGVGVISVIYFVECSYCKVDIQ